jgi:hypothetical protein
LPTVEDAWRRVSAEIRVVGVTGDFGSRTKKRTALAQLLAGHASIQTTVDTYGHLKWTIWPRRYASLVSEKVPIARTPETISQSRKMEAAGIEPASMTARRERLQA